MGESKGKFKWLVGVAVAVIAAGGGGTAWLKYFNDQSQSTTPSSSWQQAQSQFFESFDLQYDNPDLWPTGQDGFWLREITKGRYCFINREGEGEVDFQYVEIQDMDNSQLPAAVDTYSMEAPGNESYSGAGLLYRYDLKRRFYYAIILTPNGQLNVHKRNDDGYNTLYSGSVEPFNKDAPNRLAVIGKGSELNIYVNGTLSRMVNDNELSRGISGMIGIGTGRHCFDNFGIYKEMARLPE